jgi:hypothetical protein
MSVIGKVGRKLNGFYAYFGTPGNARALNALYREGVTGLMNHFHVIKESKWELRVKFMLTTEVGYLNYDVVWMKDKRGPSSNELSLICQMVIKHKLILLKEWEQKVKRD